MIRWNDTSAAIYIHLSNTEKSNKMAITWEPLVRLISNLEKAHPRVPSNIPGKFQSDRTGDRRETTVADRQTDTHTQRLLELFLINDSYIPIQMHRNK